MPTATKPPEAAPPNGMLSRFLSTQIDVDKDKRTIRFSFSSTRPVTRWAWLEDLPEGSSSVFDEVLSHNPDHWNLERVEMGACPFLKNHNRGDKLGQVHKVEIENNLGFATVKMRRNAKATEFLDDIEDSTAGGVSFGYAVHKYRVISPAEYEGEGWDRKLKKRAVLEGVDIELFEVSSEEIPADPTVGFDRSAVVNLRTVEIEGDPNFDRPKEMLTAERSTSTQAEKKPKDKPKKPTYPKGKPMKVNLRDEFLSLEQEDLVDRAIELHRQQESLKTQNEELQSEVEALKRKDEIRDQYFSLRNKAENLLRQTKLSAHRFGKYFSDSSVNDVAKLCKDDAAKVRLLAIEMFLDDIEENGVAQLNTELKTDAEPLPKSEPKTEVLKTPTGEDVETYAQNMISRLFK